MEKIKPYAIVIRDFAIESIAIDRIVKMIASPYAIYKNRGYISRSSSTSIMLRLGEKAGKEMAEELGIRTYSND